jgi:hypothetical protein
MSVQVPVGSGCPSGTLLQMPMDDASAHDLQALPQAVAQQTPCAHWPDTHSRPSAQKAPFGLRPHELSLHTCPDTQLASVVQATKQRAPLHANGAQAAALGAMQTPVALQVPGGV